MNDTSRQILSINKSASAQIAKFCRLRSRFCKILSIKTLFKLKQGIKHDGLADPVRTIQHKGALLPFVNPFCDLSDVQHCVIIKCALAFFFRNLLLNKKLKFVRNCLDGLSCKQ